MAVPFTRKFIFYSLLYFGTFDDRRLCSVWTGILLC